MKTNYKKALSYLSKDEFRHAGMLEVIKRGSANIVYAANDGVLLQDHISQVVMLSASVKEMGIYLLSQIKDCDIICLYQKELLPYAEKMLGLPCRMICLQAVYSKKAIRSADTKLTYKVLTYNDLPVIKQHYDKLSDAEIKELLQRQQIIGGFVNEKLIGFIGTHLEGGIGLLEIFQEERRKGYGRALEIYMIQNLLKQGKLPFAQIVINNEKSICLQKSLGMCILQEPVYWLY